MKHLYLRIWCAATITLLLVAGIVRIVWHFVTLGSSMTADAWAMGALLMIAAVGTYCLVVYLLVRPSKIRSPLFRICFTILATTAVVGAAIHFGRFFPSPEASSPVSLAIAILLLIAGISAYSLLLSFVWSVLKD